VINFDLPVYGPGSDPKMSGKPDSETYLHRCGRSARYGRPGVVINFVHDKKSLLVIKDIETLLKKPIEEMKIEQIPELEDIMKKIRQ
jgi:ATP-dependent RNA helicase DDX19/DBP5